MTKTFVNPLSVRVLVSTLGRFNAVGSAAHRLDGYLGTYRIQGWHHAEHISSICVADPCSFPHQQGIIYAAMQKTVYENSGDAAGKCS